MTKRKKEEGLVGDGSEKWHGTISGYTNHKCRCSDCRIANRETKAENRKARTAKPIPRHVHGTDNGYVNYKCRCKRCKKAHNAAMVKWREKKKFEAAS